MSQKRTKNEPTVSQERAKNEPRPNHARRRAAFLRQRLSRPEDDASTERIRDLFKALVGRLSEHDPVAEAQALKIAELMALAESARAKAADLVNRITADKESIRAFASMANSVTRIEGTARRAMMDFKGSVQQRPKLTLLQQKLKAEGRL